MLKYVAAFTICCILPAAAQNTVTQSMPFTTCVENLQTPVSGAVQPPVLTVDTDQVKQQEVQVATGKVVVTCTGSNHTMTLTYQQQ